MGWWSVRAEWARLVLKWLIQSGRASRRCWLDRHAWASANSVCRVRLKRSALPLVRQPGLMNRRRKRGLVCGRDDRSTNPERAIKGGQQDTAGHPVCAGQGHIAGLLADLPSWPCGFDSRHPLQQPAVGGLLAVGLYFADGAGLGVVGVGAELGAGAALAE